MTDRDDAPDETAADRPPPRPATAGSLSPAVWVSGLIAFVLLLLAVFGLR